MIQINCTQCKTLLTIDEAFAGGVCRCRHCGTIQTVPKHLKDQAANVGLGGVDTGGGVATQVAPGTATKAQQKTLWQKKNARDDGGGSSGTGLDDLANVVSSGLTSGRLKSKAAAGEASPAQRKTVIIVSACGVVIAVLVGIILFMALRDKPAAGGNDPTPPNPTLATQTQTKTSTGVIPETGPDTHKAGSTGGGGTALTFKGIPAFLGQTIGEKSVVYIIDCGQAARSENKFDLLRQAVAKSVASLGDQRKFQVLFWAQDGKVQAFPKDGGPTQASAKNAAECAAWLESVESGGQTMVSPALDRAFKAKPDAIMLVAVKATLDDNFAPNVMKRRNDSRSTNTKVYTFSVQQPELADVLKRVAGETKGQYKDVTIHELRVAGE